MAISDIERSKRVPFSFSKISRISVSYFLYLLSMNFRKISPRIGVAYSDAFNPELALRLSAVFHKLSFSCFNSSFVIVTLPHLILALLIFDNIPNITIQSLTNLPQNFHTDGLIFTQPGRSCRRYLYL